MQGFLPADAMRNAVDIVTSALGSGSLKLLGPADHMSGPVEASTARAEADAAYLNKLIDSLATKLDRTAD